MFRHELEQALQSFDITLTAHQADQFCRFYDMLIETNKVMNLTALTEPHEVAVKHMADSLSCYVPAYFTDGASLLDLWTGAGFPGIPLAILLPDLHITLFDSLQKRLNFLQSVVTELGLEHMSFLHGRAEDAAHIKEYRGAFQIVTCRAVARLNILLEWTLPYLAAGGVCIALKGAQFKEEIDESQRALKILGGTMAQIKPIQLPGLDDKRAVLYIEKIGDTPKKYPRKPKAAAKDPL